MSEATILQDWERGKEPSPQKHKMGKGGHPSSLMVIDGSPCARYKPKISEEKKNASASTQTKKKKKKREGIKSKNSCPECREAFPHPEHL